MFSPIVATFSVIRSRTVRSSSRNGWSSRQTCEYHFLSWPSTICGRMFSGFFWTDSSARSSACLAARSSAGIRVRVHVERGEARDLDGEVADELLELVGPGHEVRLAVDLDEHADAATGVDVARDEALAGVAAGLLGRRGEALLAQDEGRLLEVAVRLDQRALAVHEPGARRFAQFLDELRRDVRHACSFSCLAAAHVGPPGLWCRCVGRPVSAGLDQPAAGAVSSSFSAASRASSAAISSGAGLRRGLDDGRLGPGDAVAGQQVVVIGIGLERQRRAAGEGGHELVGRAGGLFLGLGHGHGLDLLGLGGAPGGALAGAFDRGVGDERAQQPDGPDRVVVGRDDEVELVRVDVGVAGADDRDLELVGLGHADPLTMRVDDEDGAGQALHLAHAAERALELDHLLGQLGGFLLGHPLEVAVGLARLELLEQADALLDGDEVGEHATEPALVDVGLVGAGRLLGDRLLGLLLGADEQDLVAPGDGLADEFEGDIETLDGLGQVDDVDPVALGEDEGLHLRVPAAGLVAEVDTGLEQLAHGNGRHVRDLLSVLSSADLVAGGRWAVRPADTVPVGTVRVCAPRRSGAGDGLAARGHAPDRAGV